MLSNSVALFYILVGVAFLGLTIKPAFSQRFFYNVPAFYILIGALSIGLGLPQISPFGTEIEAKVLEHITELIVIIALAGAGLAIDKKMGWRSWLPTWRLILIAMPLTICAIAALGYYAGGLTLAAAVLLGASLAPTDPVLARAVQVGPPGSNEHGIRGALTAEAGLNDGLAFPFVWLAVGLSLIPQLGEGTPGDVAQGFAWMDWFGKDVLYRIIVGILTGFASGWAVTKLLFSPVGDAKNGRTNVVLFLLAATCLSYGTAELLHGYGFLSVFIAARAGRVVSASTAAEPYEKEAHRSADQLESVLMALLLLWFGSFIAQDLWHIWRLSDVLIASLIVFIIRPALGAFSLIGLKESKADKFKISIFGVRGMGTIFYVIFAQTHGAFDSLEPVWRIASLTILLSVIIHGCLANLWMGEPRSDEVVMTGGRQ